MHARITTSSRPAYSKGDGVPFNPYSPALNSIYGTQEPVVLRASQSSMVGKSLSSMVEKCRCAQGGQDLKWPWS